MRLFKRWYNLPLLLPYVHIHVDDALRHPATATMLNSARTSISSPFSSPPPSARCCRSRVLSVARHSTRSQPARPDIHGVRSWRRILTFRIPQMFQYLALLVAGIFRGARSACIHIEAGEDEGKGQRCEYGRRGVKLWWRVRRMTRRGGHGPGGVGEAGQEKAKVVDESPATHDLDSEGLKVRE
ncbi:hypothetical protein C8F04DRAFT_303518 [Mycena alexandri]|uniref:Uncharacterized protein n=1 Tax=Mycena alexandri TaxID=1745969 RepID=A0AAD6S4B7_9AGAR|nr:hypothetical protein C8F04DRAFT_303518 [Mycena alexandri]